MRFLTFAIGVLLVLTGLVLCLDAFLPKERPTSATTPLTECLIGSGLVIGGAWISHKSRLKRDQKPLFMLLVFACAFVAGCGGSPSAKEQTLQRLVATNSSLEQVESALGHTFPLTKRGSPIWEKTMSTYRKDLFLLPTDRRIVKKLERSAAYGHTSTISEQTWIFLDEQNRLIDFEITGQ